MREEGRETTITSPTVLATTRILAFGKLDQLTPPRGAAEYTRLHTHPG